MVSVIVGTSTCGQQPSATDSQWTSFADELGRWLRAGRLDDFVKAFDWYEARLRTNNAVDFDDLLSLCVAVLRQEVRMLASEPVLPTSLPVFSSTLRWSQWGFAWLRFMCCALGVPQDVATKYRGWYRHILVDEFQDTNAAQYEFVKILGSAPVRCAGYETLFVQAALSNPRERLMLVV